MGDSHPGWKQGAGIVKSWGGWLRGLALMLFFFYANVYGMGPRFRLSSQPLTIPAPWLFLRIRWSIALVPPWVTASRFLAGNREAQLNPLLFLHSYSSLFSYISSSLEPHKNKQQRWRPWAILPHLIIPVELQWIAQWLWETSAPYPRYVPFLHLTSWTNVQPSLLTHSFLLLNLYLHPISWPKNMVHFSILHT